MDEAPIDVAAFEAQFCAKVQRDGDGAAAAHERVARPVVTKALDPKRSNAVAIMMSSLPAVDDVKAAIGTLDEAILSREQLEKIRAHLPTAEEAELIQSLDGPEIKWDRPEQFLKALMAIPRLKQRLRCWSIKYGFAERAAELEEQMVVVRAAIAALRGSAALPALFGALIEMGNHCNGGHPSKGQADGFSVDDLGKLSVMKDNTNKVSLLGYAVETLQASDEFRHALRLPDELAPLREAKVKLADVRAGMQKLGAEAKELALAARPPADAGTPPPKGLGASAAGSGGGGVGGAGGPGANSRAEGGGGAGGVFERTMARFAEHAAAESARIDAELCACEEAYSGLLRWLHIRMPPGGKPPFESDELFGLFVEFAEAVRAVLPKPKQPSRPSVQSAGNGQAGAPALTATPSSTELRAPGSNRALLSPRGTGAAGSSPAPAPPEPLDPMLQRMRRMTSSQPVGPPQQKPAAAASESAQPAPAGSAARADRAARYGAAGQRPSQLRMSKAEAVDRKLQDRLAARMSQATRRSQLAGDADDADDS